MPKSCYSCSSVDLCCENNNVCYINQLFCCSFNRSRSSVGQTEPNNYANRWSDWSLWYQEGLDLCRSTQRWSHVHKPRSASAKNTYILTIKICFDDELFLNIKKTKIMDIDKCKKEAKIAIDGEEIERVSNFEYLGARIEANGKSTPEIRRRLAMATTRLTKMISIWKGQCKKTKLRVLETVVFPTALYGCEAWTINNTDAKKITSFEMKCYRKILRISWMEKVTNKEVLSRLDMKTTMLLQKAKALKLKYFGHIKRHETLERHILEARIDGRRGRGRPTRRWEQDINDWMDMTTTQAGRLAEDRILFRQKVQEATSRQEIS